VANLIWFCLLLKANFVAPIPRRMTLIKVGFCRSSFWLAKLLSKSGNFGNKIWSHFALLKRSSNWLDLQMVLRKEISNAFFVYVCLSFCFLCFCIRLFSCFLRACVYLSLYLSKSITFPYLCLRLSVFLFSSSIFVTVSVCFSVSYGVCVSVSLSVLLSPYCVCMFVFISL